MAVATTASVRLRLSLRVIPTTVLVTLDATKATDLDTAVATPLLDTLVLATAVATTDTATAVDTDTTVKPNVCLDEIFFNFYQHSRIMKVESLNWQCQCSQIPDCRIFLAR